MVAGYVGAWVVSGEGSSRGGGEWEKGFTIFLFPVSVCAGKKENIVVQNGTISVFCCFFFFLKKERKCNWEEPKNKL